MKTHWTVLILSNEDTGIKKFKLSPLVAVFAGCVILFLTVFSAFAGYKLYHLRADISRIASIKQKNLEQSRQIVALSEKVSLLDEEMNALRTFNRHLMGIAKVDLQASDELSGVGGGSEPIRVANTTEALTERSLPVSFTLTSNNSATTSSSSGKSPGISWLRSNGSALSWPILRVSGQRGDGSHHGMDGAIHPLRAKESTIREWTLRAGREQPYMHLLTES